MVMIMITIMMKALRAPREAQQKKDDESDESMHFMHFTNTQFSIIQLQRSLLM
jgi:hypothetical protein